LYSLNPIIECNERCLCYSSCVNRVVQRGVKAHLEVFDTGQRGLGVRSLELIKKNTFVCEYAGELISNESAGRRFRFRERKPNYILTVREVFGSSNKMLDTYIDATYVGNVGRLINHSCDPNLVMIPVRVQNIVPIIALISRIEISVGSELTYDYSGGSEARVRRPNLMNTNDGSSRDRISCLCGTSKCRLVIPFDKSLK